MKRLLVCLLLAAGLPLAAQVGYPQGRYPGGGSPFPWPRRGPAQRKGSEAQQLANYSGTIRRIDDKALAVEDQDHQTIEFRLSETRFYRDAAEIKATELKAGDQVSVSARQDRSGYLYAVTVRLERAMAPASTPSEHPKLTTGDDDPDRPRLRRGIPDKPATVEEEPALPEPAADPVIERAREAAASFGMNLPNYVTTQYMTRYASASRPADWRPLDVVSADVVYENGRESYRNLQVNGKATKRPIEEVGGSWSTGEFGSILLDLFSPNTAARFTFDRASNASGMAARVYAFEVEQPRSHWRVLAPAQTIRPAYRGSVWIEPKSGRVLRIEMQARKLPANFPLDTVETAVDYSMVRIGSGEFLLPVRSETLSCERGTPNCTRNTIDFRNYHKFDAATSVTFDR